MDERKYAILFAATILAARKLHARSSVRLVQKVAGTGLAHAERTAFPLTAEIIGQM